jgi:formylglycine-generating enzyme required for sulfatase activity
MGGGIILEMVAIPGGTFLMGSPATEKYRHDDESPQHTVRVAPFFMAKYPVTQAQWRAVAAFPKINIDLKPDPSDFKGANRPVEQVNWHEAVEFCARLSQKTGKTYRLPSEAEWEYACRAGTTTPFHFGETITPDLANYDGGDSTYASETKGIYREQTTDVGSFLPNAFGLYDMHGNVWEWCADPWHENYQGAPVDGSVWEFGGNQNSRLQRGGSWFSNPRHCRSAYRLRSEPDIRSSSLGFRAAVSFARTP